jgi:transaldolase
MLLYIDTASLKEIKDAAALGVLDGVTTNPSLIAKENVDYGKRLAEICEVVPGPVSAEVISTDYDGMIREGRERAKIAKNIVVKLPSTVEGLRACKTLVGEGLKTNMTLCFQPLQALMVAKAGAFLVSPFIGRLDDVGEDGMVLISQIRQIYDNYGYKTMLLAASIRSPKHMVECALAGADAATVPFPVIKQMMNHPLTDQGLEKFLADYKKAFGEKAQS